MSLGERESLQPVRVSVNDGYFVRRVLPSVIEKHRCSMPDPSVSASVGKPKFTIGTIWRCECGRMWKVWWIQQVLNVGTYICRWRPYPRWYDKFWNPGEVVRYQRGEIDAY